MSLSLVKNVLVVARPRTRAFYEYVAPRVFEQAEIHYLSENRGADGVFLDLMELFYRYLDSDKPREELFTVDEFSEMIVRDRYLRSLDVLKAQKMIRAMSYAVEDALDKINPDVILSIMTDNYIMALFERIQTRRKGLYIGTVVSLLDGYSRLTRSGELWQCRDVSDQEVGEVYSSLMVENFKPEILKGVWIPQNKSQIFKAYIKEKVKNLVFPVLKTLKRDPLNFHYNCLHGVGATSDQLSKLFFEKYFDHNWLDVAKQYDCEKTVLIPMQFNPESSIDYMCQNLDHIDHDQVIIDLLKRIPKDRLVLLKEHPAMVGKKDVNFYKKLKAFSNVQLISPLENMRVVLEYCGHVITWSGSTGLEGRLLGKNIMCLQLPYYYAEGFFHLVHHLDEIPMLLEKSVSKSEEDGRKIIKSLLAGCIKGQVKFIDFDENNPVLKSVVDELITNMRIVIPNLKVV
jgi:hypothetical protein